MFAGALHAYNQADFAVGALTRPRPSSATGSPRQDAADQAAPLGDRARISPAGIQALLAEEDDRAATQATAPAEEARAVADSRSAADPATSETEIDEGPDSSTSTAEPATTAEEADQATEDNTDERPAGASDSRGPSGVELTEAELRQVTELQQRDREVRTHEQAHIAAAGGHARGGPSFTYQQGPDGKRYAVGGEVSIDTGKAGEPQATILKMQTVRRAALAPAEPSAQDRAIANRANFRINQAHQELAEIQAAEQRAETDAAKQQAVDRSTVVDDDATADDNAHADRSTKPATSGTAAAIEQLQRQELGL